MDYKDDLANALSEKMLGHPYDPNDISIETLEIERLLDLVDEYEIGDTTLNDLIEQFALADTGYDVALWVLDMEEMGIYAPARS